jgi:CubicO group peptidase (beta-lactamase class C family)
VYSATWFAPIRLMTVLVSSVLVGSILVLASCRQTRNTQTIPSVNPAINAAMETMIAQREISGAVTLIANKAGIQHMSAVGYADIASKRAMRVDDLMWIASMTKPITAAAIMQLQDAGKLNVNDPVEKFLPEFAKLATDDGNKITITLQHLLTHTSGLAESSNEERARAKKLADLFPGFTNQPLKFVPGTRWAYCQSGINTLGRIIEIVSGESYPAYLQNNFFTPLGMVDTTFYPDPAQQARLATVYKKEADQLIPDKLPADFSPTNIGHYPAPNGGLFSTASDFARFCRMMINDGSLDGRTYLSKAAVTQMRTLTTGDIKTGFTPGNGWGLGVCVVREPQGVSEYLSPGSYGHGAAYGTQFWIDPKKDLIYILLVQRQNFANSDNSDVRKAFQAAAQTKNL